MGRVDGAVRVAAGHQVARTLHVEAARRQGHVRDARGPSAERSSPNEPARMPPHALGAATLRLGAATLRCARGARGAPERRPIA